MIIMQYDAVAGEPIPDGMCETTTISMHSCAGDRWVYRKFSTENIFATARLYVAQGKIPSSEILFAFEDTSICLDEHGRASYWPKGFCAYLSGVEDKLMDIGLKVSRKEAGL